MNRAIITRLRGLRPAQPGVRHLLGWELYAPGTSEPWYSQPICCPSCPLSPPLVVDDQGNGRCVACELVAPALMAPAGLVDISQLLEEHGRLQAAIARAGLELTDAGELRPARQLELVELREEREASSG